MSTIRKRGSVYWLDGYIEGNRVQRSLGTCDKRLALERLNDFESKAYSVKYGIKQKNVTYEQFRTEYLQHCRDHKRYRAFLRDSAGFTAFEKDRQVQHAAEITPDLLIDLRSQWRKNGRGVCSRNRDIRTIKTAMRWAQRKYDIALQDWSKDKPERENKRIRWFNKEEVTRLLAHTAGHWRTAVLLGVKCGLRPAEIYHLIWDRVDLQNGILRVESINCDCSWCRKSDGLWQPKTEKSQRSIPLDNELMAHLATQKKMAVTPWVVSGEERMTAQSFDVYFRKILLNTGLRGSLYTLRHTFASHLVNRGENLSAIRDLMGHSKVTQTEVYAHVANETLKKTIDALPTFLPNDGKAGAMH